MSLNRKYLRKQRKLKMRVLEFAPEVYELSDKKVLEFKKSDEQKIGIFELIWNVLHSPGNRNEVKTKKDIKITKRLKSKLRSISRYKDKDQDSRVLSEGPQKVVLEEDEYEMLNRLLSDFPGHPSLAEDFDRMWEFLDGVKETKLELITNTKSD